MSQVAGVAALALALVACGRIGFDLPGGGGGGGGGTGDGGGDSGGGGGGDSSIPGIPAGLIAWYPLDDDFALVQSARDASGNGHTAGCTACPSRAPGRSGGFSGGFGGAQFLLVDTSPAAFDFPDGYTIALWVRASVQTGNIQLLGRALGASNVSFALDYTPMNGKVTHVVSTGLTVSSANRLTIDGWNFAAISWDGATVMLYLDTFRIASSNPTVRLDAHPISIGATFDGIGTGTGDFFTGAMADVMIFDHALTVPEVGQLYMR